MMLHCLLLLFSAMVGDSLGQDTIISTSKEEHVLDGSSVTLSCNYSSADVKSLHWYRQHRGSKPEFLILIPFFGSDEKKTDKQFTVKLDKTNSRVHLEISSAEVTDSALYYCALQPGYKIIFGSGTQVTVQPRKESSPRYYKLKSKDDAVSACLATDFSAYNATHAVEPFSRTETSPTRIDGESYFDKVVVLSKDIQDCPGNETDTDTCDSGAGGHFETDEKVNFLSLTVLGLRILFLKSIVFNVLMTLRAWMS